jgi:hypothetical protein
MAAIYTYHGYKLTVRTDQTPPVAVFDPRVPRDPAIYKTTSLDEAMRWVDAYRDGLQWAIDERLK